MKKNPYSSVKYRTPVVASELRFTGSRERVVGSNGELNASSKMDLAKQIAKLMEVAANQNIQTEDQAVAKAELAKEHRELVKAAFNSKEAHAELGEVLAEELYQASNREGFMRRLLARQDLSQGQIPIIRMRMKNVVATVATSPARVNAQLIRDNLLFPPEFYISSRPFIEQREVDQSVGDVLEEKYIEGLESVMVGEDRTWYKLANATVNISNPLTTIVGTMNPQALANLRTTVTRWDIPVSTYLIASDIWNDIIGDVGFAQLIDPVSKHELLLSGQLGTILGMGIVTDAFRHPQHKVLNQGEMFCVGDPINHGTYSDRGGINSQPIDGAQENIPGRGWWMTETVSMLVANSRSVSKATRS